MLGHQIRLATLLLQGIGMARAGHVYLRLLTAIAGLQRHQIGAHLGEFGLGLGHGDPEGLGVQLEQRLTGLDLLVFGDEHLGHPAQHLGTDGHLVRLHIGIVGLHIASAVEVNGARPDQDQCRYHHQQQQAGTAPVHLGTGGGG
ncbi:hypothetical protein D3C84_633220 [compost metagenome]